MKAIDAVDLNFAGHRRLYPSVCKWNPNGSDSYDSLGPIISCSYRLLVLTFEPMGETPSALCCSGVYAMF